jgi:hypothetical protein
LWAAGAKPEIDALAIEFIEWCLDRAEDERIFGTRVGRVGPHSIARFESTIAVKAGRG